MSPRRRTRFVCSECGGTAPAWSGRCPHCSSWNSLVEETVAPAPAGSSRRVCRDGRPSAPVPLPSVEDEEGQRVLTGIEELDRVLGGGVLRGSVNLVGGEPGIGKSTLMIQLAGRLASTGERVLYASGEESPSQVAGRAARCGSVDPAVSILAATALDDVARQLEEGDWSFLVVDSIQTLFDPDLASAPGSVSQVRHCAGELVRLCKGSGTTVMIVGHVTKTGALAGPKVLEHMVDAVIYFEGSGDRSFRLLRAAKNRFGSTNELGVFEMTSAGLEGVRDASAYFLGDGNLDRPGTAVTAVMEGTRPFLVEVQALTSPTRYGYPQRSVNGMDSRRLPMLLAVLEKRCGMDLGSQDVYVNVAGGVTLVDPGADLGVCLAVASSRMDRPLARGTAVSGEVGLGGELRPVPRFRTRMREAVALGFGALAGAQQDAEAAGEPAKGFRTLSDSIGELLVAGESEENGGRWL